MISKITEYAEKMQYRHPPIQEHLVYSHLICMYMYIYIFNPRGNFHSRTGEPVHSLNDFFNALEF